MRSRLFSSVAPLEQGITLIEASAGTGKTYNITNLFIRLVVEQGLAVRDILVVTFTRAATAELRARLRARLLTLLSAYDRATAVVGARGRARSVGDEVVDHLLALSAGRGSLVPDRTRILAAIEAFDEAAIYTIHGFCQRALQQNAFESGVDFDLEIVDDLRPLLLELVQDFWTKRAHNAPRAWLQVLSSHKVGIDDLVDLAQEIAACPDLHLIPEATPGERPSQDRIEGLEMRWVAAQHELVERWRDEREEVIGWLKDAVAARHLDGRRYQSRWIGGWVDKVSRWIAASPRPGQPVTPTLEKLSRGTLERAREVSLRTRRTGQLREPLPVPPFKLLDACQKMCSLDEELFALLSPSALALKHELAGHVKEELGRRMARAHVQSYDDLLHRLRGALTEPGRGAALTRVIRRRYKAALIDEFQDTDAVQWSIFERVFGEGGWLYLIGDPKQSIYSFRGADIFTYLAARGRVDRRHHLGTNWRSDARLVKAVNSLYDPGRVENPFIIDAIDYLDVDASCTEDRLRFEEDDASARSSGPETEGQLSLCFDAVAARQRAAASPRVGEQLSLCFDAPDRTRRGDHLASDRSLRPRAPLEVRLVGREGAELADGSKGISRSWARRSLAALVARDVARLLAAGAWVRDAAAGGERPLRPRDVAVLVRSHHQADLVQQALRSIGHFGVVHGAKSVFASRESDELARLLAAVVEPRSAARVRAALCTDLLGISAVALAGLEQDEVGWERWITSLRGWGVLWNDLGFFPMFRRILAQERLPERILSWSDGERRMTNLLHLAELLHTAAVEHRLSPAGLLEWLSHKHLHGGDPEAGQLRLESDEGAVEIATVHGSKGLEYPVVFLPFLWDTQALMPREIRNLRIFDEEHGPSLDISLDAGRPPKTQSKERAAYERRAESLRLAYVALTRARHRCVLYWGWFSGAGRSPLAHLLHQPPSSGPTRARTGPDSGPTGIEEVERRFRGLSDAQIEEDLKRVTAAAEGCIEITRTGEGSEVGSSPRPSRSSLTSLVCGRSGFDLTWRRASFTQMTRTRAPHVAAAAVVEAKDRDEVARALSGGRRAHDGRAVLLGDFPGGTRAGLLLHKILELHDVAGREAGLRRVLAEQLPRHGIDADQWIDPLTSALTQVLGTPLDGPAGVIKLGELDPAKRLCELDFDFSMGSSEPGAGGITLEDLTGVLARAGRGSIVERYLDELGQLGFPPLRGFMTGSIDLVFRHGGRWFIVDYKSNHLGPEQAAYTPERLEQAMIHGHYVLQYLIYSVALHRYLQLRLPEYDLRRCFGGVYYLFLRGMAPGAQGGVFHDRPSPGLIRGLDSLFHLETGGRT